MAEREQLEQAIAALEAQRAILGDAAVDAALAGLRARLVALEAAAPKMAGERRMVTVMFADLSGFTALAERMDPEAVRDLVNACFEHLVPVIRKYEGTVDKFIGDEIMALFGAPVAHENDPERALRAALEMQEELTAFNAGHGIDLGIHFGINTGLVIAGDIGTQQQQEYSVMGDAVNVAARLEDLSARGQILVGPDTVRLTAPLFEFAEREPVRVKGKEEPILVYQLLRAKAAPGSLRGIPGLSAPLVGREGEFRALQEAVARLRDGLGGVVTLVGEAGLGKSRLVAELRHTGGARHASPLQWLEGRCLSYGGSIAYLLWADMLRALLGSKPDAPLEEVRQALRARVQAVAADDFAAVYPFLGRLLGLPLEGEFEEDLQGLDGEQVKAGIFGAAETLIGAAARTAPLVLVCEDLHWADPSSLELLEHLLPLTASAPLLLLCVLRPERDHRCMRLRQQAAERCAERHTDLWLHPLAAADSAALVGHLLRVEELPVALRERILGRAEGNPFYLEEIIRALITAGDIVRDEASGRWRATRDVADIAIPDTLHGVLMARIDRLQEETKRILQLAAVVGRIFLYRVLAEIAAEERGLEQHLGTLQREDLIRERARQPELEYIFKHHLTQEAAYSGLLLKERRAFHRQVAEALERLFAGHLDEQLGLLAYHWEQAAEGSQAAGYLLRAGDQARLAYAHLEAADYYQRALVFMRQQGADEQAARTLMKLGLTCHNAFEFARSRQAYEEGFALWQRAAGRRADESLPPAPHALRLPWLNVTSLDWTQVGDVHAGNIICQLFSGLLEMTAEMDVVPDVAHSWEIEDGGRRYVFHLRDDVRWSDGRPVTAADFCFTWRRMLLPATASPAASYLYVFKGARDLHQGRTTDPESVGLRCPDPFTLVVDLEGPVSYSLLLIASGGLPVPQHAVEAHGQAWTEPGRIVTNGPFRLESWERGRSLTMARNPTYHGQFRGNLERVEFSLGDDFSAALVEYEANRLDLCELRGGPVAAWQRARERHAAEYVTAPQMSTHWLGLNRTRPPLDDVRVRRALAMAIDREMLTNVTLGGQVFPALGGYLPPGMPGHSPGIALPYDPQQARRLLAEAGYPGGRGFPALDLLLPQEREVTAQFLQAQWRETLSVRCDWQTLEWTAFLRRLAQEPPRLFTMGSAATYPDPDDFMRNALLVVLGFPWYDETYDRLVEQAQSVANVGERMRMYQQADRILVQDACVLPLYYARHHFLLKPWVSRFSLPLAGPFLLRDVVLLPHG